MELGAPAQSTSRTSICGAANTKDWGRVNGGGSGGVRSLIDAVFTWDASRL